MVGLQGSLAAAVGVGRGAHAVVREGVRLQLEEGQALHSWNGVGCGTEP